MVGAVTTMPFHGIISKGLLNKLRENNIPNEVWLNNAHLLEKDLNSDLNLQDLLTLKEYAADCKVLSFSQSATCVKRYMEKYIDGLKANNIIQCEIWNIKEGHASSVWKVTIVSIEKIEHFAVNIARDDEGGISLMESSEKLKIIGSQFPKINLAKVLDIYVLQDISLPSQVVITKNEWIDNSYEVHSRKNKQTGEEELLMVERFLTSENNPTYITSVLGRIFTTEEVKKIQNKINIFLTKAAACLPEKPEININDGDVVWNGRKAIVVAIS